MSYKDNRIAIEATKNLLSSARMQEDTCKSIVHLRGLRKLRKELEKSIEVLERALKR